MLEDDLGDERAGLQVAPALELEQVALGAHDGTLLEPLEEAWLRCAVTHAASLSSLRGGRRNPHGAQVPADRGPVA